jgi:MFS family permease
MSTVVPRTPSRLVVVLRTPQVPYVLLASLIGRLPLGAAPLALLLYAHGTMSAAMTGLLVGSYTAGTAIGQPMLSRMADRWRQAPVVLAAIVLSTAGFLVITLAPADGTVIAAAFAAGLGAPPFEACLRVLWRVLVGEHHLHSAYTVDVTVQELIFIAGPLMTVAAVNLGGPTGGLIAIATAQAVGALLFLGSPAVRRWRGEVATRHWAGPLRSARLRPLLFATMLVGSSLGCMTIAVAAYSVGRVRHRWPGGCSRRTPSEHSSVG